jgi:protein TonB
MKKRRRDRLTVFILASILLHFLVFGTLALLKLRPTDEAANQKRVRIVTAKDLTEEQRAALKAMQLVQQDQRMGEDKVDPNAKYLSKFDQKVDQEMRARRIDDFKNLERSHQASEAAPRLDVPKPAPKQEKAVKEKLSEDGTKVRGKQLVKNILSSLNQQAAQVAAENGGLGASSGTDDYLKNLPEGERTLLNTREYKFYSYFERIRGQLKQVWKPLIQRTFADISFTRKRAPASDGEKVTRVAVLMDNDGNIKSIDVVKSSGVAIIDSAAVEAFHKAGPFPNPPTGMVDDDGSVRLQWEFVLVISS